MRLTHLKLILAALSLCPSAAVSAQSVIEEKARVLVLTDIGNEPDDSESLVRFLLYANEFDIEGIVATTSTWQRDFVQPELLHERVEAHGAVLSNLRKHADGHPSAEHLQSVIRSGAGSFGMEAVGPGKDTEASRLIIEVVDKPDPRRHRAASAAR